MQRERREGSKAPLLDHGHEKGIIKHPFPMNYLFKPWKLGNWVYRVFKFGIVQYVSMLIDWYNATINYQSSLTFVNYDNAHKFWWQMIVKTFTAILAVILEAFDAYCEGDFRWNCG